jgi:hypothetical protein
MMKRFTAALAIVSVAIVGFVALSPASGQDRTEERLSALETRVAVLETAVAGDDGQSSTVAPAPDAELSFSGTGDQVIEGVTLDAGLLICAATHSGQRNFIVELYGPGGEWGLIVNDIGPYDGGRTTEVEASGPNILSITADGTWTLDCHQP